MRTIIGKIKSIEAENYKAVIEIPNFGELPGVPIRFENEPKTGDEVIALVDDNESVAIYCPLKILTVNDFVGIARSGNKMDFELNGGIKTTTQSGIEFNLSKNGKIKLSNNSTNLKKVLMDIAMAHMKIKTIDGQVLDPGSINDGVKLIQTINQLFYE